MQFVGFRSVIVTMWAVDDGETNKITSTFYGGRVWSSESYPGSVRAEQDVEVCGCTDQRILYVHPGD
jgi:hypothetical protein